MKMKTSQKAPKLKLIVTMWGKKRGKRSSERVVTRVILMVVMEEVFINDVLVLLLPQACHGGQLDVCLRKRMQSSDWVAGCPCFS